MTRRGVSLTEAVVAIFLLTAGFIVTSKLFHQALQYESRISTQQIAVTLAERQLELIRSWSRDFHRQPGNAFTNWAGCPGLGGPTPVSDYPDYRMTVTTSAHTIASPCSEFENLKAVGNRRQMNSTCRLVDIVINWSSARQYRLRSLVAVPAFQASSVLTVKCTPASGTTVGQDGSFPIGVQVVDSTNAVLPDVFLAWYNSGDGNGTLDPNLDGSGGTFTNRIAQDTTPVTYGYGIGACVIIAYGKARGQRIQGQTGNINVQVP